MEIFVIFFVFLIPVHLFIALFIILFHCIFLYSCNRLYVYYYKKKNYSVDKY